MPFPQYHYVVNTFEPLYRTLKMAFTYSICGINLPVEIAKVEIIFKKVICGFFD